jgi:peptidoglycan/LPS O-acetylase OafA/YrhL
LLDFRCSGGLALQVSRTKADLPTEMKASDGQVQLQAATRYPVLDACRFILAFVVVTAHLGVIPLFAGADTRVWIVRTISHGFGTLVYGMPAVICFFVISGFCIHLPFRDASRIPVGRFYARRYIRIMIPVLVALAINRFLGERQSLFGADSFFWYSVLWSLLCEEIYYAVYPALWWCRRKFGWVVVLPIAFAAGAITALVHFHWGSWGMFGPIRTAIILYPVWLMGCWLAEQTDRLTAPQSSWEIWRWRGAIWMGSWVCLMLNFKFGIYFTQTMLWFGILALFWIRKELSNSLRIPPVSALVSAGAWSYSLYLVHIPALTIYRRLSLPSFGPIVDWCLQLCFALAFAYVFYLLVEVPSHRLARRIGTRKYREPSHAQGAVTDLNP